MLEKSRHTGRVYHRAARPRKGASRTFGESADWSDHQGCEALYTNKLADIVRCFRPMQWVKNLLLLAAPFFAFFDHNQPFAQTLQQAPGAVLKMLGLAILTFILLSASAYVLNDICDCKADAKNPIRKHRPIAARKVSFAAIIPPTVLAFGGGIALACFLGTQIGYTFTAICAAYIVLQPIYTLWVRRSLEAGAIVLAIGFVLRAMAGAVVVDVRISPWLLLCVFLVSLFVVLCKRRCINFIKSMPQPSVAESRIVDLEIAITAAATVTCYALYTLATETIAHFGTEFLVWTILPVVAGIFRYLRLTYSDRRAGNPETALVRDPIMAVILLLWIGMCGAILTFA